MDYQKFIKKIPFKTNHSLEKVSIVFSKIKKRYSKYFHTSKAYKFYIFLACFISLISFYKKPEPLPVYAPMDTVIPYGHVLIPIEIANSEVLEEILGSFGIINLYTFSPYSQKPSKLIVKNIRIIQSPKKNGNYAVLSPDEKAKFILSHPQPFFVAIKNPKETKSEFQTKKKKTKRIIEFIDD